MTMMESAGRVTSHDDVTVSGAGCGSRGHPCTVSQKEALLPWLPINNNNNDNNSTHRHRERAGLDHYTSQAGGRRS